MIFVGGFFLCLGSVNLLLRNRTLHLLTAEHYDFNRYLLPFSFLYVPGKDPDWNYLFDLADYVDRMDSGGDMGRYFFAEFAG